MKILRNTNQFKIKLNPYKIHIKEIENKTKTGFQYTCILPPFLCSYFNIQDTPKEPNLLFYTYNNRTYVTTMENLLSVSWINLKQKELRNHIKMYQVNNTEIPEDLQKDLLELPEVNYNLYDKIENKQDSTAYQLSNSNSFRCTLPNKLFKNKINNDKNNYVLFTIDTLEKDFTNNYGVVKVDILQE